MAKRKQNRAPDEEWIFGPFAFARFGNTVVGQNTRSPEESEAFRAKMREKRPELRQLIQKRIDKLRDVLTETDPLQLLEWTSLNNVLFADTDEEPTATQKVAYAEYAVNLAAATAPWGMGTASEETAKSFADEIKALFHDTMWYFASESTESEAPTIRDEIRFSQIVHYLIVRGDWYPDHYRAYLNDVFGPWDETLKERLGATIGQLVAAGDAIAATVEANVVKHREAYRAYREFERLYEEARIDSPDSLAAFLARPELKKFEPAFDAVRDGAGPQAINHFQVEPTPDLPVPLLDRLSLSPGENKPFNFHKAPGWPTNDTLAVGKPLLKVGKKYYCFVPQRFVHSLHIMAENALQEADAKTYEAFTKSRGTYLENQTLMLLGKLLPKARVLGPVYYDLMEEGQMKHCEADGLVLIDDVLIAVEAKAGSASQATRRGSLPSIEADVNEIVNKAFQQGQRLLDYIRNNSNAVLDTPAGRIIIDGRDYHEGFVVATSLAGLGPLLPRLSRLREMGTLGGTSWPWAVTLGDLRVITEVLPSGAQFLLYLKRRTRSHDFDTLDILDELDAFMYFLANGLYLEDKSLSSAGRVSFFSHTVPLDKFYAAPAENPCPSLKIEDEYRQLVAAVEDSGLRFGTTAATALLELGEPARRQILARITQICKRTLEDSESHNFTLPTDEMQRAYTFASFVNVNEQSREGLLAYCEYKMQKIGAQQWYGFALDASAQLPRAIVQLHPDEAMPARVEARGIQFDGGTVVHTRAKAKVGRNDRCPCGSGKKFKKCCGP